MRSISYFESLFIKTKRDCIHVNSLVVNCFVSQQKDNNIIPYYQMETIMTPSSLFIKKLVFTN